MEAPIAEMAQRVIAGEKPDRAELVHLVELGQADPFRLLYWAHRIRTWRFGAAVKLCSIAAGKLGACGEDCKWCAQASAYAPTPGGPKRTDPRDIVAAAREAAGNKAAHIGIVNSGRRPSAADLDAVADAARRISAEADCLIGVCASLGELTEQQGRLLADAGVTRYNHNLETSRRMFARMVTTHTYDDRLRTLSAARNAGLKLCCGGIFALGETWDDRIELALMLRDEVRPAVTPLNFLHPIAGTPLAGAARLAPMEILRIIALFRFALPGVDLKIAGGREANLRSLQSWMFYAGATSCLIGNYLTTPGRSPEEDLRMIEDLGLTIVNELPPGDRRW